MWFISALISVVSWGIADLFYKMGTDPKDKYSHLKIVIMVGLVMGIHGFGYMIFNKISYNPINIIRYIPVTSMYILSMTIGYMGLRYIELSISSPLGNSSGAVAALLTFIFLGETMNILQFAAVAIISVGMIILGFLERKENIIQGRLEDRSVDNKYTISTMAIVFPILYCIIDGIGTFADAFYLDRVLTEAEANLSYEFTFMIVGIIAFIYLAFVKKEFLSFGREKIKLYAAIFETLGQFFYVFAMAQNSIVTAPLVASYSIVSVILSRVFLKERLNKLQYTVIVAIMISIGILGME
ncbi:EamA family transporter [uncultured Tissierella sp.]|jgi:drug/metabolite transporter (DMT)-like permease|uniref:EamA family transporter n=1 Tax=uncultured Tissierella sp. TaxID=448160 RepID=UPI002804CB54|nr:EamA family transporter [uncultured Tissierella sp.]MDU5083118.1 EamA family transporter [Bacillota bacterium]